MTITEHISGSDLFRDLIKRGKLKHPTAAAFDAKKWVSAAAALASPTMRDYELMLAAIYFGDSIAKLRPLLPAKLSEPFTRESGTRLLVGIANEQYLTLRRKSARLGKRIARDGGAGNLEQLAQSRISSPTGQSMTGDDHVTHLIDSLPHWLHQLVTLPADKKAPAVERPFEAARDALMLASVSRSLRDLWHAALWEGREVVHQERFRVLRVADRELAERWLVWNIRWQSIMAWEAMTDAGALLVAGRDALPVTPVQTRTVVRIERPQGRKARIVVGRADGHARRQRSHVSERDMLDRLYTGIFMDEALPKTGTLSITCRELMRVWWLLEDLGETIVGEIGNRAIGDGAMLRTASCTWPIDSIEAAVATAMGIDLARAAALLRFVTLDPTDTSSLFDKSLWWTPLVPGGNGRCHLLLAPLFAGNPVRLVEHWLEVGGISDQGNLKGRGRSFEAHVRSKIRELAGANPLITDFEVLDHGLKRKGESEEIDLLVRIGDTVIVGEVKCFLSPVEPSDRYNYLVALEKAADQARRKLEWVDANRAAALAEVGITDPAAIKAAKLLAVVVLNQGNGIGLTIEGVPFVDFHYLSLVIGSGRYQADTGFTAGRTAGAMVDLYSSQADLQARLPGLLKDPPPLRRFAGKIEWTAEPFPSPDGKALMMEIPRLAAAPMNEGTIDQLTAILGRRS